MTCSLILLVFYLVVPPGLGNGNGNSSNSQYTYYRSSAEITNPMMTNPMAMMSPLDRSDFLKQSPYELTYHPSVFPYPTNQNNQPVSYTKQQSQILMEDAIKSAWEQYGPRNKLGVAVATGPNTRDTSYNVPLMGFQPSESEWDAHVIHPVEPLPPPPPQPSVFSRIMNSYLSFEVNQHETADFIRKVVVYGFFGLLALAWISLGGFLGLLPFKLFGAREALGGFSEKFDTIADRVMVALDGDWLKTLQKKLEQGASKGVSKREDTWIQCCLLPDEEKKGKAECQMRDPGNPTKSRKCQSDLTYNLKFGPNLGPKESNGNSQPLF